MTRVRTISRLLRDQRGALLMEALVAITVFTLMGGAVLAAMSTTHRASGTIEASAIAENIARNAMEMVLAEPYPEWLPYDYENLEFPTPPGYSVTAEAVEHGGDPNVARIKVMVTRDGQTVLTLEVLRLQDP